MSLICTVADYRPSTVRLQVKTLVSRTVRPRDTRPQAARTLQVQVFEKGSKNITVERIYVVKTLSSTVF